MADWKNGIWWLGVFFIGSIITFFIGGIRAWDDFFGWFMAISIVYWIVKFISSKGKKRLNEQKKILRTGITKERYKKKKK